CLLSVLLSCLLSPPLSTLFPYTTLFRSVEVAAEDSHPRMGECGDCIAVARRCPGGQCRQMLRIHQIVVVEEDDEVGRCRTSSRVDRKSTRLNSSHQIISYAVFCLKKKTQ